MRLFGFVLFSRVAGFCLEDRALFSVSRARGDRVVDIVSLLGEDDGEHATCVGLTDEHDAPVLPRSHSVRAMAHLFHFLRSHIMPGDVRDVPWIPDQTPDI